MGRVRAAPVETLPNTYIKSDTTILINVLAIFTLWSISLQAQAYPIHVAPMATSCVENADVDPVNCTDNLIWDILLSRSSVCTIYR
jgi:hypothetical protein